MTQDQRDRRELLKGLRALSQAVADYVRVMDGVMKQPSTVERGKQIAKWLNRLEYCNDYQKMFTLKKFAPKRRQKTIQG